MLRTLVPRKGYVYPVDDQWRARVEQRLRHLKMSRAQLAEQAGCPRSLVTELLETQPGKRQRNHTTYLPEIHRVLSWPEPKPGLAPADVPELSYIYDRLDEEGREAVIAAARRELDRILEANGVPPPTGKRS